MSKQQIFIIGTGRSGSTVLRRILGLHSNVYAYPNELRFIADADGLCDLIDRMSSDWNPFNASLAIHRFKKLVLQGICQSRAYHRAKSSVAVRTGYTPCRYRSLRIDDILPEGHVKQVLSTFIDRITLDEKAGRWYGSPSYTKMPALYVTEPVDRECIMQEAGQFVDNLLSYPLKSEEAAWCDDTPINVLYARQIAEMLPTARLIHIYRDPRDVVASYADQQQLWAPNDFEACAKWVVTIMHRWWKVQKRLPANQYIEVCYEDLVREQESYLRKVINFAGFEFEDGLMDIELTDKSIGRYKQDIPSSKRQEIVSILQPVMEEYDYALKGTR